MKMHDVTSEAEGTPEGVPHLSKELITHIIQQVGTEGAHAIVKSLQWGDGAAKELLQLIVKDLKQDISMAESVKQRLDPKCWKGKHKEGTKIKGGVRVNNCVPNEGVAEGQLDEKWSQKYKSSINCSNPKGFSQKAHCAGKNKNEDLDEGLDELSRVLELSGLNLSADEQFDIIEEMVEMVALEHGVDAEQIWEDFESVDDEELLESAAWHRKAGKSASGGLNDKGIASYRREHPGSHLQKAVTTKPSKLKKGSKAAKRRKSFCARMSGVKGPMKKPNGKPTRKALALRKWNC